MKRRKRRRRPSPKLPVARAKSPAVDAAATSRPSWWSATEWPLWLLLWSTPFVLLPGLGETFRLPKLVVAELLALVSIAALALRLVACRRLNWRVFITAPAVLAGLPLVAWATLGLALTEHPQLVASRLPSLWIGLAALWAWSSFLSSERRWMLLRWTIVPAVVLAVFGIAQFHGFSPFVFSGKVTDRLAVTSLAGGAFDLSAFLILPILIAQHALAVGRRLLPRLLWLVALAVCAYALVATQTLGSLGAVIVGSMVFWIAGAATGRSARRGLVAVAVALAVALAAVATVGPLRARAEGKVRSLRVGDFDRVFTGRFDGWRTAAWMIREEPIHGVGHGAFRAEFGRAKEALVEDGVGFFRGQHLVFFENAHSEPLEVAAELGLVGLLALGWGFVSLLRRLRLWRLRRSRIPERSEDEEGDSSPVDGVSGVDVESAAFGRGSRDDRRLAALELAAWVAILLVALIDFPFHLALLAFPWLLLASDTLRISDDPMDRLQASGSAPGRTVPGWVAATAMVLVLTLALGLRFGVLRDRLRADGLVNAVETRTVQASQAGTVTALLLQQHLDILRQAEEMNPTAVGVPIARGGQYYLLRRYAAAERAYRAALELEPRGEIWANLARTHLAAGDREAAHAAAERAMVLDHNQQRFLSSILPTDEIWRERRRRLRRAERERSRQLKATPSATAGAEDPGAIDPGAVDAGADRR